MTDIPTGNSRDSTAGNPKIEKQSPPRTSLGHPPTPEPSDSSRVLLSSDQHSHGVLCQINSQTVFSGNINDMNLHIFNRVLHIY